MPLVVPNGYVSLAFVHSDQSTIDLGTDPFVWTLGTVLPSGMDAQDAANVGRGIWDASIKDVTSSDFQLDYVTATIDVGGGGTGSINSEGDPIPGLETGDPTFTVFAPKVRKNTAELGRQFRGLFHLVGAIPLSQMTNSGTITSGRRDTLQTAVDDMYDNFVTALMLPALLHTSPAVAPTPISSFSVATKVGVLRNRLV